MVHEVVEKNEYRLPDGFTAEDVIIDIGGNIGAFSWACLIRGAGSVTVFEPELENYRMMVHNLLPWAEKVCCYNKALWSCDKTLYVNGPANPFTACYHVLSPYGQPVGAMAAEPFFATFPKIRMLKIDAEGSERPILDSLSNGALAHCQTICGEIHYEFKLPESPPADNPWLVATLARLGFQGIEIVPNENTPTIADFFASRP
jgi:FkbM family methyltransferase